MKQIMKQLRKVEAETPLGKQDLVEMEVKENPRDIRYLGLEIGSVILQEVDTRDGKIDAAKTQEHIEVYKVAVLSAYQRFLYSKVFPLLLSYINSHFKNIKAYLPRRRDARKDLVVRHILGVFDETATSPALALVGAIKPLTILPTELIPQIKSFGEELKVPAFYNEAFLHEATKSLGYKSILEAPKSLLESLLKGTETQTFPLKGILYCPLDVRAKRLTFFRKPLRSTNGIIIKVPIYFETKVFEETPVKYLAHKLRFQPYPLTWYFWENEEGPFDISSLEKKVLERLNVQKWEVCPIYKTYKREEHERKQEMKERWWTEFQFQLAGATVGFIAGNMVYDIVKKDFLGIKE